MRLKWTLLAAVLLATASARAAEFGTTNVQLLQGFTFDDDLLGYDTQSGRMTTVTLNHFSTWAYGDNFAFVDLYRGDFKSGSKASLYAEWHPRLFLNKLGLPAGGVVKNWGLAGEINQGPGFYAYLGGLGLDLALPGFTVAGLNLYYRYDNFAEHNWQVSPFWTVPFSLGPTSWLFTGFLDVTTNKLAGERSLDFMFQPELLLDVGTWLGAPNRVHVGCELYAHGFKNGADFKWTVAPQAMAQWTIF